jgi:uncharacterized protein
VFNVNALPVNEFILKVASRCNLDCDYCYEYRLGDESWRRQPAVMSLETAARAADRIGEHARAHALPRILIALHGGEPMLAGAERLDGIARILREKLEPIAPVDLAMQSNATLVDDDILRVLEAQRISVGVSIDGPREANDLHRLDHAGRSSFDATVRGIAALRDRKLLHGLLSVIDVRSDPLACFDFMASLGIEQVDFLLPHHNWTRPPFRPEGDGPPAYGEWYARIWRAWLGGRHAWMKIRYLEQIVRGLIGAPGLFEGLGLEPTQLLVLTTDGSLEGVDTLKSCGDEQQKLELSLFDVSIDAVMRHRRYLHRQQGATSLAPKCQQCPEVQICGGGYLPHRYAGGSSFAAPSVYCDDILHLISTIREDVLARSRRPLTEAEPRP